MSWRPEKARIPRSLRNEVFTRDHKRCQICHVNEATEVDHIIPDFEGGPTILGNLMSVCYHCHKKKSTTERQRAQKRYREAAKNPPWKHPGIID